MQRHYQVRVKRIGGFPALLGGVLLMALLAGLVVLIFTFGLVAMAVGLGISVVAGLALAVHRGLGLSRERDAAPRDRFRIETDREWTGARGTRKVEIIDVEEVVETRDDRGGNSVV